MEIKLSNILNHLLTGKDNKTYDIARCAWMVGFIAIIFMAGYEIFTHQHVDLKELAESLGIISGAHGAAIFAKQNSEPSPQPDSVTDTKPE